MWAVGADVLYEFKKDFTGVAIDHGKNPPWIIQRFRNRIWLTLIPHLLIVLFSISASIQFRKYDRNPKRMWDF